MNDTQKDILKSRNSKWTKRDYEMVAAIIAQSNGNAEYAAHRFADTFANDSPLFDRERFLRACGVKE